MVKIVTLERVPLRHAAMSIPASSSLELSVTLQAALAVQIRVLSPRQHRCADLRRTPSATKQKCAQVIRPHVLQTFSRPTVSFS